MPKRRPPRRTRRGRPPEAPAVAPVGRARPVAPILPVAAETARPVERERAVTRFSVRDYAYVRREVQRILVLATAIIIALVVLSFFLP